MAIFRQNFGYFWEKMAIIFGYFYHFLKHSLVILIFSNIFGVFFTFWRFLTILAIFEKVHLVTLPEGIIDENANLLYVDELNPIPDIHGNIPKPGFYILVAQYYQPDKPSKFFKVLILNMFVK